MYLWDAFCHCDEAEKSQPLMATWSFPLQSSMRSGKKFNYFSGKTSPLKSRSTLSLTPAVLLCLAMALMIEQSEAAKALPNAVETKEKEDMFVVVAKVLGEGACLRMVCKLSCACLLVRHAVPGRHAVVEAWLH